MTAAAATAAGLVPGSASAFVCIVPCARGTSFDANTIGGARSLCTPCPSGTTSLGGLAPCQTCVALGYGPNAYVDTKRGRCVPCGARASVVFGFTTTTTINAGVSVTGSSLVVLPSSSPGGGGAVIGASCKPCPAGQVVPPGSTTCAGCRAGYYVPAQATECVPCPPGTFYASSSSSASCTPCPVDRYSPREGATACLVCPNGTTSASSSASLSSGATNNYTRTACAPCRPLNSTLFPFVQYFQPGCVVRCTPGVSYLRTNLYAVGGCGNCSALAVSIGAYKDPYDCTVARPCTNAPANARYSAPSSITGASACPWTCNTGFQPHLGSVYRK